MPTSPQPDLWNGRWHWLRSPYKVWGPWCVSALPSPIFDRLRSGVQEPESSMGYLGYPSPEAALADLAQAEIIHAD